ncbi:MAG: DNA-binding protein WhiA [Bacillota bacterium]
MSFSRTVKEELARAAPDKSCCQVAELAGLIRAAGTLEIAGRAVEFGLGATPSAARDERLHVWVETGQAPVARKLIQLGKAVLRVNPEVLVRKQRRLRRSRSFSVALASLQPREDLVRLGVLTPDGGLRQDIPEELTSRGCCRRAYLRGLFLGSGSVNDPGRSHHLEMVLRDSNLADQVVQLLFSLGVMVRVTARRGEIVLYLKEADQIGRLLGLMGAHQALLAYENVLALKTVKNRVNRLVNAETANLEKTVDAAVRQIEDVKLIRRRLGLQHLPPSLRELAELRLKHPEASLKELGLLCDPPVGKSGVAHRLRRLEVLAGELRGETAKTSKRTR